jgi:hypothetical protein
MAASGLIRFLKASSMIFSCIRRFSLFAKPLFTIAVATFLCHAASAQTDPVKPLDGITFASNPGHLYVSIKGVGAALGTDVSQNDETGGLSVGGHSLTGIRHLFDGAGLMPVAELRDVGATVSWDPSVAVATIHLGKANVTVHQGTKTVIVDKSSQSLMAYQGGQLVLATHVSTGREGHGTPNGNFSAGPAKERMHLSRLYHFAPMPWSVQVQGNVFIHGYTSVPNRPASHGCIRVPLNHGNPAHYFFNWVDVGTPVTIKGVWNSHYAMRHAHSRYAYHRHRRTRRYRLWASIHGHRWGSRHHYARIYRRRRTLAGPFTAPTSIDRTSPTP